MPSYLHPRSAATSTLFAGTLLASFVVVAVPHIWPCPRPRKAYMDSEIFVDENGRTMRRVRKVKSSEQQQQHAMEGNENAQKLDKIHARPSEKGNTIADEAALMRILQDETAARQDEAARRPCPVPKPKGVLGRWLGFDEVAEEKGT